MQPILQTSILGVDCVLPESNSGAIYFKLPAVDFSLQVPLLDPNIPKSTILILIELMSLPEGSVVISSWRRIF
jgi:hypothetical protein